MPADRDLFGVRPPTPSKTTKRPKPKELAGKVWTEQKSVLIAEYLHLFLLVTRTGAYLDLFAGPQGEVFNDDWSIKRVIERRTEGPNFKYFAACDLKAGQIVHLERLRQTHLTQPFKFVIYRGDANEKIDQMLHDAPLDEKVMPCFCLIDQRAMECDWETVRKVADFKSQGYKIEIFYFLAERWLDRTWRSIQDKEKLRRWWGRDDYVPFLERQSVDRAFALRDRFCSELGYKYAEPWSIHQHGSHGITMFYMVHASDHPRARLLMSQAYHATPRVGLPSTSQSSLFSGLLPGDGKN